MHGIRIRNPEGNYDYDLILEIDHILEWVETPDRHFEVVEAPARLIFHDVDKLCSAIDLTYKEDLEIDGIGREAMTTEPEQKAGFRKFQWQMKLHSLAGRSNTITFEASGFIQELTKKGEG